MFHWCPSKDIEKVTLVGPHLNALHLFLTFFSPMKDAHCHKAASKIDQALKHSIMRLFDILFALNRPFT